MQPIYMPPDPRFSSIRDALLGGLEEILQARKRNDVMGQLQAFMKTLPGMSVPGVTMSPGEVPLSGPGGAPSPMIPGVSPSGGVDLGTMPAPAEEIPGMETPFDLKASMSTLKDPQLAMSMFPTAMDTYLKTRPKAPDYVPFKTWKYDEKNETWIPNERRVPETSYNALAEKAIEKGLVVGDKPDQPRRTENWTPVKSDGKNSPYPAGVVYQVNNKTGEHKISYTPPGVAKDKVVSEADEYNLKAKKINTLQEGLNAIERKWNKAQTGTTILDASQAPSAYQALQDAAGDPKNPRHAQALKDKKKYEETLAQIEELSGMSQPGKPGGSGKTVALKRNADGSYTAVTQ